VGINIGKSRDVALEAAADDYLESFRALYRFADYFAINVSSPNTPGLRDLQSPEQLEPLLQALQTENDRLARERRVEKRPLLVKVSPDLSDSEIERLIAAALRCGVAGFIATNTTIARPSLEGVPTANEAGGLSGEPLRARSTSVIRAIRSLTGGSVPIIGVGGIFTAGDAYEKILAGASLVQIYTGFVFEGPNLPRELHRGLRALLQRDGFSNIREAVGRDA
jgi:dihydroorotate dehydrogenase